MNETEEPKELTEPDLRSPEDQAADLTREVQEALKAFDRFLVKKETVDAYNLARIQEPTMVDKSKDWPGLEELLSESYPALFRQSGALATVLSKLHGCVISYKARPRRAAHDSSGMVIGLQIPPEPEPPEIEYRAYVHGNIVEMDKLIGNWTVGLFVVANESDTEADARQGEPTLLLLERRKPTDFRVATVPQTDES